MQNSSISFTSKIRVVPRSVFAEKTASLSLENFVDYPWGAKEIIKSKKAFTTDIDDCSAGGITNGKEVVMFHIQPSQNNLNQFEEITKTILKKLGKKRNNLQGFLIGGSENSPSSATLFNKFRDFMEKRKIPFSFIKGDTSDIVFSGKTNEWIISNPYLEGLIEKGLSSEAIVKKGYQDSKLCPLDTFV